MHNLTHLVLDFKNTPAPFQTVTQGLESLGTQLWVLSCYSELKILGFAYVHVWF